MFETPKIQILNQGPIYDRKFTGKNYLKQHKKLYSEFDFDVGISRQIYCLRHIFWLIISKIFQLLIVW